MRQRKYGKQAVQTAVEVLRHTLCDAYLERAEPLSGNRVAVDMLVAELVEHIEKLADVSRYVGAV